MAKNVVRDIGRTTYSSMTIDYPNWAKGHIKSDQPGSHVFRRFLGQLSTHFHEIW